MKRLFATVHHLYYLYLGPEFNAIISSLAEYRDDIGAFDADTLEKPLDEVSRIKKEVGGK